MTDLPALKPYEQVDTALRQSAARIAGSFFGFVDLAARAIDEQVYVHYGFSDPFPYFEQRIGIKYRTVKRWLSIREAVARLPEGEQPEAREALATIGAHKAGVIAPLLGSEKAADWRALVDLADGSTEDAIQEHVSTVTGTTRRRADGTPGARFLAGILQHIHPDVQDYVREVFTVLMREYEADDPRAAFLIMVDMANRDLGDAGVDVKRVGG
jgi:hypothetical protein